MIRYLLTSLTIAIAFAQPAFAGFPTGKVTQDQISPADTPSIQTSVVPPACENPHYFIFIGNPGSGKSTLINSLLGKEVADAGVSPGTGLTKFFSAYEHAGNFYMDTPGLADVEQRVQAAREIEAALAKNGVYRIFFVITLEAGRVKPEDVATINTVMDAIKIPKPSYNIIVNKLTPREKNTIINSEEMMARVYQQLNSGHHQTNAITYIDNDPKIDSAEKNLIEIDGFLGSFVYMSSKSILIKTADVASIQTDDFQALREQFASSIAELTRQVHRGNQHYAELFSQMIKMQERYKKAQKNLKKSENKIVDLQAKLDRHDSTCYY